MYTSKFSSDSRQMYYPSNIILLLGSLLVIIGISIFLQKAVVAATQPTDLDQDYIAASLLVQGRSIYTYAEDTPAATMDQAIVLNGYAGLPAANNHPPFDAILAVPLVFVSYPLAAVLWSALSLLLYLLLGYIILAELRLRLANAWIVLALGIALCWYPLQLHIATGQLSILLSACVIGCWALLRRRCDTWAGLLLGLACLIKLFPLLIIAALLLRRRWRAAMAAVVSMGMGWLVALALAGPADVLRYFTQVMPMDAALYRYAPVNLSLGSFLSRLFSSGSSAPLFNLGTSTVSSLSTVGTLILAVILAYRAWVDPRLQDAEDSIFSLACIVMILISPITWQHVFPVLMLPLGLLLRDGIHKLNRRQMIWSAFAFLFVSLPYSRIAAYIIEYCVPARMPWAAPLLFFSPTIGLILLCWLMAARSGNIHRLYGRHSDSRFGEP